MPRLLLVDDNPSIHRIAESLLAPTDVELVCVDSAAAALDRIERGEGFDVILVDTAMPGMDGWTLLTRLREMKETAHLPIALMAGVLDPVDPAKLAKAPVQGFLKKPIELRELGDRVKALLATPMVPVAEPSAFSSQSSAFTTVPATPARDLVRMAETALPEFRPEIDMEPAQDSHLAPEAHPPAAAPAPERPLEDDLLMLSAEDLWPEEAPAELPVEAPAGAIGAPVPGPSVTAEVHLELEDLDLESLHDLASGPLPPESLPAVPELPQAEAAPVAEALGEESLLSFTGLDALDEFPGGIEAPALPEPPPAETVSPSSSPAVEAAVAAAAAAALVGLTPSADPFFGGGHEAFSAPIADEHPGVPVAISASDLPGPSWAMPAVEPQADQVPAPVSAVPGQVPAAAGQEPLMSGQIQALLADPVLMDALVKAVVARMGDQVIREIAWEVMPDLAGKLQK